MGEISIRLIGCSENHIDSVDMGSLTIPTEPKPYGTHYVERQQMFVDSESLGHIAGSIMQGFATAISSLKTSFPQPQIFK